MYSWVRLSHIAQWTTGKLRGGEGEKIPISKLSTDTRSTKPGDLFLALKGENYDANDFLEEAIKKGAAAVVTSRDVALKVPTVHVPDTLAALIAIGENLRDKFEGTCIGITGSAGKSSTKEMIATLLGERTVASPASFNNLMGVSRTLCLVEDNTKNLVLEMGMNAFGEIKELCDRFKPHAGLITNIGDAHIGKLGGKRGIWRAKKEMFDYLASREPGARGIALNIDDSFVLEAAESSFRGKAPSVTYSGAGASADVRVLSKMLDPTTGFLALTLEVRGKRVDAKVPIFGFHHAENIAAAVAMLTLLGHPLEAIVSRLGSIRPASHRGEVFPLAETRVLIDESYNSNPSALTSSLTSLLELDPTRRRVLVIGEMRELGEFSHKLHGEVGETLKALHRKRPFPYLLVGVGEPVTALREPMGEGHVVASEPEATQLVLGATQPGDIIFVKGSRGVGLDKLVGALRHAFPAP